MQWKETQEKWLKDLDIQLKEPKSAVGDCLYASFEQQIYENHEKNFVRKKLA